MLELLNYVFFVVFLAIGYFFGQRQNNQNLVQETIKQIKKQTQPVKPGVIDYPSQADIDYTESGEEKVDKARTALFLKYFIK